MSSSASDFHLMTMMLTWPALTHRHMYASETGCAEEAKQLQNWNARSEDNMHCRQAKGVQIRPPVQQKPPKKNCGNEKVVQQ